jgi:hypothetical protein
MKVQQQRKWRARVLQVSEGTEHSDSCINCRALAALQKEKDAIWRDFRELGSKMMAFLGRVLLIIENGRIHHHEKLEDIKELIDELVGHIRECR